MKTNLGSTDRVLRLMSALILATLYFTNMLTGTIGIIAAVVAAVLAITALISFCPIYALLGIKTCSTNGSVQR